MRLLETTVPRSGLFITFEGGDACGKTTQIELTARWLRDQGCDPLLTREPGGTELGVRLRQLVMHGPNDVDSRCEALIYAADRAYHVATRVVPALQSGRVVLQDRYLDSSIAYQGAARDLGVEDVRELNLWATKGLLPNVTILLDIDPEQAAARREGARDRLERESVGFHAAVRAQYLQLAREHPRRIAVVDATGSVEEVSARIREAIAPHLHRYLAADSLVSHGGGR